MEALGRKGWDYVTDEGGGAFYGPKIDIKVKDALGRLARLVGSLPDWADLEAFLPPDLGTPTERRAALSSTLLASLEMARGGMVNLRQEEAFGPILVRRGDAAMDRGA